MAEELVPRRYSEKEVARILRRATELQRAEPSARNPDGLSLAELEEIAREAGIDPVLLRRAAAELAPGGATTFGAKLAGAPLVVSEERVIEGEIDASRLDNLVPLIQESTPWQGSAGAVGKALTWVARSDANTSSQQVLVTARDGRTVIRVEERLHGLAGALYGAFLGGVGGGVGIGVGGAIGGGVFGSVAAAVTLPAAIFVGSFFAARAIFAAQVRKRGGIARALADRLADRVREEVSAVRSVPPGEAGRSLAPGAGDAPEEGT